MAEECLIAARIAAARKRKIFHHDDHNDNCGSNLHLLEKVAWTIVLIAEGRLGVAIDYPFGHEHGCCSDFAESSEDELDKVSNGNPIFHYLVGSSGVRHRTSPFGSVHVPTECCVGCLSQFGLVGAVDVMELFG